MRPIICIISYFLFNKSICQQANSEFISDKFQTNFIIQQIQLSFEPNAY